MERWVNSSLERLLVAAMLYSWECVCWIETRQSAPIYTCAEPVKYLARTRLSVVMEQSGIPADKRQIFPARAERRLSLLKIFDAWLDQLSPFSEPRNRSFIAALISRMISYNYSFLRVPRNYLYDCYLLLCGWDSKAAICVIFFFSRPAASTSIPTHRKSKGRAARNEKTISCTGSFWCMNWHPAVM